MERLIKVLVPGFLGLMLCTGIAGKSQAIDRSRNAGSVSVFTGDNLAFSKVTLSSTTASTLGSYSTSRGAITCINSDSTNQVWIASSTVVSAAGAASFPLKAGSAIQFVNNGGLFAIGDTGVSSTIVYCVQEY